MYFKKTKANYIYITLLIIIIFVLSFLIERKISSLEDQLKETKIKKNLEIEKLNSNIDELNKFKKKYLIKSTSLDELSKVLNNSLSRFELSNHGAETNKKIEFSKNSTKNLYYKNYKMIKYIKPDKYFLNRGINNFHPGSAYLDFFDGKLYLISSLGFIASGTLTKNNILLNRIENNIKEFININQFGKHLWFSIKDLKIIDKSIYVSYTHEYYDNCWNTSLLKAELNTKFLKFEKLFSPKECINEYKNQDSEFNAHQSGGRIIDLDDNMLIFTLGEYRSRYLAQDLNSPNGKIIKVNKENGNYSLISVGHRNPQGIVYDKNKNILIETEHGPKGGDEINFIDLNSEIMPNFGWPISSYGEHYGDKEHPENQKRYKKYPLKKSHIDHNFVEPLKYFVPSIGISEIVKINENHYVVSSLKDKSIYFLKVNNDHKLSNLKRVYIGERIRDLIYSDKQLILFLEDSASIGIVKIN